MDSLTPAQPAHDRYIDNITHKDANICYYRYDYLQAQSAAEQEMHDRTAAQLDTYNRKIREMRREIQELLAENQQLQGFKVRSIYFKIMH